MRKLILPLVLLCAWAIPSIAHADSVTYDLTLTNVVGNVDGGTGSFTIDSAPSTAVNSVSTYQQSNNTLTGLTITIDNQTFTLAEGTNTYAQFISGDLTDLTYFGYQSTLELSLAANGLEYQFYDGATGANSVGTVSASLASSTVPTPEPASLLLFGTGALGLAFASRRLTA